MSFFGNNKMNLKNFALDIENWKINCEPYKSNKEYYQKEYLEDRLTIPVEYKLEPKKYFEQLSKKDHLEYFRLYALAHQELEHIFWQKVNEDFGLNEFPQKLIDMIHNLAWDDGHSSGLNEVYNCVYKYAELADLAFEAGKFHQNK